MSLVKIWIILFNNSQLELSQCPRLRDSNIVRGNNRSPIITSTISLLIFVNQKPKWLITIKMSIECHNKWNLLIGEKNFSLFTDQDELVLPLQRVLLLKMRLIVVGTERLEILHIGCCLSLAAYVFFFSESNAESTSNASDLCSGSIVGFDDEPVLSLMFRYEKWHPDFRRHPSYQYSSREH